LGKGIQQYFELVAIAITAALKFIMMDWLQWRGVYIAGICIFWLGYVVIRIRNNKEQPGLWGFRREGFRPSMFFLIPFIVISILGCLLYAGFNNNLFFSWRIVPVLALYPLWGIIQQFLMLGIISQNLGRLDSMKGKRVGIVLIVSALFSLMHFPDFFLVLFTFCLEILFITVYFKWKNLWAIGMAHGWIATFLLYYVLERSLWQELFLLN